MYNHLFWFNFFPRPSLILVNILTFCISFYNNVPRESLNPTIIYYTGWNDKIVVLKKTTLQLYFQTFIEKINSGNLIM